MSQNYSRIDGLAGLVLAAGASARLGQPKALLLHHGQPLICCAVAAAGEVCGAGVSVVTGAHRDAVQSALQQSDATRSTELVHNNAWQQGMGGSLAAGVRRLEAVPESCSGVLVMLCDQPLLGSTQYAALGQLWQHAPAVPVAAAYAGAVGVPAIFPRSWFAKLAGLQNDQGARKLLQDCPDLQTLDMPEAALDIDTPNDLHLLD